MVHHLPSVIAYHYNVMALHCLLVCELDQVQNLALVNAIQDTDFRLLRSDNGLLSHHYAPILMKGVFLLYSLVDHIECGKQCGSNLDLVVGEELLFSDLHCG